MTISSFFDTSSTPYVYLFLIAAGLALVVLVALGLRFPHLARIALRHVPRRPARTALIIFGLMFSTMFIASSLEMNDAITLAVKSVAVFNLGKIDEDVAARFIGGGPLRLFPTEVGSSVVQAVAADPRVAGVAPALVVPHVFVADTVTRQVRGNVTIFALASDAASPLSDLRTTSGAPAQIASLTPNEIYLNRNAGALLNAHAGDTIFLTAPYWQNQQKTFTVLGIVTGGPLGDAPSVVMPLPVLQSLTNAPDQINNIYVANAGDGLTGVSNSDSIADEIQAAVPYFLYVDTTKLDGVNTALRQQDIFGRILTLYTLFALTLGLLLIFLIFVLLAAERRAEIGTIRALGMRQRQVVLTLLFEGAIYDLGAAAIGILAGLAISDAIITVVSPTLTQIGFPLQAAIQPQSIVIALSGGFLFTLATIWVASGAVSRMTVAAALRDLPEPSRLQAASTRVAISLLPLLGGAILIDLAVRHFDILIFSFGLSLLITGGGLAARALALLVLRNNEQSRQRRIVDRLTFAAIGGALALYWSLPFDALVGLGLPRFSGGIEVFFIAGVMMILGAVLALAPNLDILLMPVRVAFMGIARLRHVLPIALAYPVQHRFRTAIGLSMFSLVVFTMVVIACIASSVTAQYDNLPVQAAGYDIAGHPLTTTIGGANQLQALLRKQGGGDSGLADVSSATSLLLGMFEPGASNARWHIYPAAQIDGAFLSGVGLPLVARAQGYASDAAVWDAVRRHPGDVVIDTAALDPQDASILGVTPPPQPDFAQFLAPPVIANIEGFSTPDSVAPGELRTLFAPLAAYADNDPNVLLQLTHIAVGSGVIAPTALWVGDLRGGDVTKLTIVGVVDNAGGQRYGLLGSPATFAPVESQRPPLIGEYYYFKVSSGTDSHREAQRLGSLLFDQSFETTVLSDLLLNADGPRVFISRVLVGLVGLTLLVGMAALAVTGSRAVIERRQQIGMLRALGFRGWHVQVVFLLESLLIGAIGMVLGLVLGLALCRNVFAVDFFEPLQSGLVLVVPWVELGVICAAALGAALVASLLPAWQAGRVAPADALRYE